MHEKITENGECLSFSWVFYEEKLYSGNMFVLSEGDYPNLTSMGCPPDFTIRSIKAVPMVSRRSAEISAVAFPSSPSQAPPLPL